MKGSMGLGPLGRSCVLTLFGADAGGNVNGATRKTGAGTPGGVVNGSNGEVPGGRSVISTPASIRDSCTRVNSALRRWSVEREQVQPAPAVGHTAEPVNTQCQERSPTIILEDARPSSKKPTAGSEQSAGRNCEQDKMNRTKYQQPKEEQAQAAEQEQASGPEQQPAAGLPEDYYEVLQISRSADLETIHRVYRIMALRFHPDNTKTGNLERFLLLKRAYQVLSDPQQRAAYDAAHSKSDTRPLPHFESKDFVYGVEGEVNRRLGVLSLLYHKRRMGEGTAGMSVLDLENRMAFPREYLNFTLWYLRSKHYIMLQENSDYALTAEGVDYVEAHSMSNRVIRQLLTSGCEENDQLSDERPSNGAVRFAATARPASPEAAA